MDECDVNGDVNACSEGDVGENLTLTLICSKAMKIKVLSVALMKWMSTLFLTSLVVTMLT